MGPEVGRSVFCFFVKWRTQHLRDASREGRNWQHEKNKKTATSGNGGGVGGYTYQPSAEHIFEKENTWPTAATPGHGTPPANSVFPPRSAPNPTPLLRSGARN